MSLQEAKDAARVANARHGKPMSRADRALVWASYVADGKHLECPGEPKASRVIAEELEQMWSHETVRQKLRALGLELDEDLEWPEGYKAYGGGNAYDGEEEEEALGDLLAEELERALRDFGGRFSGLPNWHRERLLKVAQGTLAALEKGEEPDMAGLFQEATLF